MDKAHDMMPVSPDHLPKGPLACYFPEGSWSCGAAAGLLLRCLALVAAMVIAAPSWAAAETPAQRVCRPVLAKTAPLQLGETGVFRWTCPSEGTSGGGYYVVFVRPTGTYVLLKVPEGQTSFEFAPDAAGKWRWIVINTDPDRTKPDVESEPGSFAVTPISGPLH